MNKFKAGILGAAAGYVLARYLQGEYEKNQGVLKSPIVKQRVTGAVLGAVAGGYATPKIMEMLKTETSSLLEKIANEGKSA
jgi:hypothetical protein